MNVLHILLAAFAAAPQAHGPSLLSRSHIIARPHGWAEIQTTVPHYLWVTNKQILVWKDDAFPETRELALYNLDTHKTKGLPRLSEIATQYHSSLLAELSPNRKWLLMDGAKKDAPLWLAVHLDGTGLVVWPRHAMPRHIDDEEPESIAHWTAAGDHFTETELTLPKGKSLIQVWTRPFPRVSQEESLPSFSRDIGQLWADAYDIGGYQMLSVSQTNDGLDTPKPADLYSWLATAPSSLRHYQIPLPKDTIAEDEFSPDRKKLLWEFRQGLGGQPKDPKSLSLWVSDTNGRNLRMIGQITVKDGWKSDEDQHFGEMHWLPDSKHVSFIYFGKLYEVSGP